MIGRSIAIGGIVAILAASPAAAQLPTPDPAIYVPDYGAMIAQDTFLRQSLGQPGAATRSAPKPKRKAKRPKPVPRPTARQRATLKFGADPAVSDAVNQFFLEHFAAPGVPAETVVADLNRLREIGHSDLRHMRWNARHLADVATYVLLVSYGSVNDTTRLPPAGVKLLRRAVTDELARDKSVRRLSDAEQQRLGELLMLRVGYYVGWRNDHVAKGNPDGAETLRADLRRFVRSVYGIDVSAVRLTSRGFSPKH